MNPANQNAAAPQQGQQQQQPQRPNIMKMVLMYMAMNYVINFFFKGNNQQQAPGTTFRNLFNDNEPFEFKLYISNSSDLDLTALPVWEEKDLAYNYDKENLREKVLYFDIDQLLSGNASDPKLYAHFYLDSNRSPDTENYTIHEPYLTQNVTIDLIEWREKDRSNEQENLLFSETTDSKPAVKNDTKNDTKKEKFPHLKTQIWIQLIHDMSAYHPSQVLPNMGLKFVRSDDWNQFYLPPIDISQFWLRKKDFSLLDPEAQNKTLNVTFSFNTYWIYKYMLEVQMKQANTMYADWGMENNMEEVKEMVLDANPYLFAITMIVSVLHSVFEFLALKNDIAFWKNVESHKGLSLRSLWVSLFTEIIVLLYLFDNDTSTLILVSSVAGLGVTIWKIFKTTKLKKREDNKFPFYELDYQDTYKSTTMEYDQAASKYLIWIMIPLLIGYTVYSLVYEKHKGWYSFVVQTLVGFIYVFGFIEMTPQLYINYKLKSVEHLPWRVLVYKFLNTIVDDLFAFVITMPWLKRLSCFRDDIIFIIYLYQRWVYRVDKNRDPYGNSIPKDQKPAEVGATQPGEKKAIKEGVVPSKKEESSGNVVTQRNVEESQQNKAQTTTQSTSPSKGSKMKKKKVE